MTGPTLEVDLPQRSLSSTAVCSKGWPTGPPATAAATSTAVVNTVTASVPTSPVDPRDPCWIPSVARGPFHRHRRPLRNRYADKSFDGTFVIDGLPPFDLGQVDGEQAECRFEEEKALFTTQVRWASADKLTAGMIYLKDTTSSRHRRMTPLPDFSMNAGLSRPSWREAT